MGVARPLPEGSHLVDAEFAYDGGGPGRGGTVALDGEPAELAELARGVLRNKTADA